jgi:hypothetical protein
MANSRVRRGLERELAQLREVQRNPESASAKARLFEALASASCHVVARAASIVLDAELLDVLPTLMRTTLQWFEMDASQDPGCTAKTALIRALYTLGAKADEIFLAGIRRVQQEYVWNELVDTAPELRGLSGLALVRTNYIDTITEVAELLADPEPVARMVAAQAIAYSERQELAVAGRPDW